MPPTHTVDLELRTDDGGDLLARGTVGGQSVLVAAAGDGLVGGDVAAFVPLGDDEGGPTTVAEGEERRFDGVELRHGHRVVEVADGEGRRVTLDARADTPAVGVQVRQDDGSYRQFVGRVDGDPRRLRMSDERVGYERSDPPFDRAERRLPEDGDTERGRDERRSR